MKILKIVLVDDDPTYLVSLEYLLKKHFPELHLLREQHPVATYINLHNIALPCLEGLVFVDTTQILYCASDGNYTYVHLLSGQTVVVSRPLKDMEQVLEGWLFFRTHKQYLVNLNFVTRYNKGDGGEVELSNATRLPVARNRKEAFLQMFSR